LFETHIDPASFIDNPLEVGLLLDWEAEIIYIDNSDTAITSKNVKFIYTENHINTAELLVSEPKYFVAQVNSGKESAFDGIFNNKSQVWPQAMFVHSDVIKLHKNGHNPYFFGKTFWINNEQTEKLEPYYKSAKSKTDICQNCEFRHVCIDNRLPKKREAMECGTTPPSATTTPTLPNGKVKKATAAWQNVA
jgi:hypothetical protein